MAKSAAEKAFDQLIARQPDFWSFRMPMVADSTNEVTVDIATGIDSNKCFELVGGWFRFEVTGDPNDFGGSRPRIGTVDNAWRFQIQRGQDQGDGFKTPLDVDVLYDWELATEYDLQTNGAISQQLVQPFKIDVRTITFRDYLSIHFATAVDDTLISDAAISMIGKIYYYERFALNEGQTKIGRVSQL